MKKLISSLLAFYAFAGATTYIQTSSTGYAPWKPVKDSVSKSSYSDSAGKCSVPKTDSISYHEFTISKDTLLTIALSSAIIDGTYHLSIIDTNSAAHSPMSTSVDVRLAGSVSGGGSYYSVFNVTGYFRQVGYDSVKIDTIGMPSNGSYVGLVAKISKVSHAVKVRCTYVGNTSPGWGGASQPLFYTYITKGALDSAPNRFQGSISPFPLYRRNGDANLGDTLSSWRNVVAEVYTTGNEEIWSGSYQTITGYEGNTIFYWHADSVYTLDSSLASTLGAGVQKLIVNNTETTLKIRYRKYDYSFDTVAISAYGAKPFWTTWDGKHHTWSTSGDAKRIVIYSSDTARTIQTNGIVVYTVNQTTTQTIPDGTYSGQNFVVKNTTNSYTITLTGNIQSASSPLQARSTNVLVWNGSSWY